MTKTNKAVKPTKKQAIKESNKRKRLAEEDDEQNDFEPEVASEGDEDEQSHSDKEDSNSDNEDETLTKKDGFADTIMNLLKQDTGSKLPVLSGRKTTLMKQMQEHQREAKQQEQKRLEKKRKIEEKMLRSQENNIEFERQLRKLATKGVVALFNAVAKAKKEIADAESAQTDKNNSQKSAIESEKAAQDSKSQQTQPSKKSESTSLSLISNAGEKKNKQQTSEKKWSVLNESATEDLLMDWDQEGDD